MKRLFMILLSICCVLTTGCCGPSKPAEPPKCRVVTEITIKVENAPEPGQCRYTDSHKMTKALNCLRRLDLWDCPDTDPESSPGARYRIMLTFSDGSTKYYDQVGHTYLRENGGPWQVISADHGLRIPLLLAAIPSDSI